MRRKPFAGKTLNNTTEYEISFSDVDSMGVVWHGHYVRLLEYGREAWGKQYGMGYMDVYAAGYMIPVVHLQCDYKAPLVYGDRVEIRSRFLLQNTAKLQFEYELHAVASGILVCTGKSSQVFIDAQKRELQLTLPEFYRLWLEGVTTDIAQ